MSVGIQNIRIVNIADLALASGGGSSVGIDYDDRVDLLAASIGSTINIVRTGGYYTAGDGGGATYVRSGSATDTQSADGAYWAYLPDARGYNVLAFGAIGDGSTSSGTKAANIAAFDAATAQCISDGGGTVYIPRGEYVYDQPWLVDLTAVAPGIDGTGFVSVEGDGSGMTQLTYTNTSSSDPALKIICGTLASGSGFRGPIAKGFTILGPASVIATSNAAGLHIEKARVSNHVDDVKVLQFYRGTYLKDIVGLKLYNCHIAYNNYGLYADPTFSDSPVNELSFFGCHFANNRQYGAYFEKSAPTSFFGGSFEGNGQPGAWVSDTDRYDIKVKNCGHNGGVMLAMYGVHFESSGGDAQIWIEHDTYPGSYMINGCDFLRNGARTEQSTNSIRFDTTGTKRGVLAVMGCGFHEVNAYTPTTSERYIAEGTVTGTSHKFELRGNYYNTAAAIPDLSPSDTRVEADNYSRTLDIYDAGVFQLTAFERYTSSTSRFRYGTFQSTDVALVRGNVDKIVIESAAVTPGTSDSSALGTTTSMWSDLFLASGAVINWNNGDVLATHSSNTLTFTGASSGYKFDAALLPNASDGAALGSGSLMFSDLYLASGGIIVWDDGDVTATHSANTLTFNGAANGYRFNEPVSVPTYANVASLPSAITVGSGARALVADANATTFHSIVAGGGANIVPVFSDGSNWRIG